MKIISKFKDYYDYLSGIYGVDPKLVLDRTKGKVPSYANTPEHIILYICGIRVEGYYDGENFYYGENLLLVGEKLSKNYWLFKDDRVPHVHIKKPRTHFGLTIKMEPIEDKFKFNKKLNCPIILCASNGDPEIGRAHV